MGLSLSLDLPLVVLLEGVQTELHVPPDHPRRESRAGNTRGTSRRCQGEVSVSVGKEEEYVQQEEGLSEVIQEEERWHQAESRSVEAYLPWVSRQMGCNILRSPSSNPLL